MKLGTENRTITIVAIALFALAIFMLVRIFSGGGQPAAAANPTASTTPTLAPSAAPAGPQATRARRGRGRPGARAATGSNPLDPRLRLDLLQQSEATEYKGAGRNIFRAEAEPVIPKPVVTPVKAPPPPPVVYTPPPPPPINLKFFGFATPQGEAKKVFLGNGDDVFVAAEGDIVNRRYKVMKINSNSVEIEDVLSNNRQTIPLTAG